MKKCKLTFSLCLVLPLFPAWREVEGPLPAGGRHIGEAASGAGLSVDESDRTFLGLLHAKAAADQRRVEDLFIVVLLVFAQHRVDQGDNVDARGGGRPLAQTSQVNDARLLDGGLAPRAQRRERLGVEKVGDRLCLHLEIERKLKG